MDLTEVFFRGLLTPIYQVTARFLSKMTREIGLKLEKMYLFLFVFSNSTVTVKFINEILMNFGEVCFNSLCSKRIKEMNNWARNATIIAP